jgi:hypothetical protein
LPGTEVEEAPTSTRPHQGHIYENRGNNI